MITLDQYRDFLQTIPYPCVTVYKQSRVVLSNPHAEHLFGYTSDELAGRLIDTLLPELFREGRFQQGDKFHLDNYKTNSKNKRVELDALHRDGSMHTVEIGLNPVEMNGDLFALVIIRDLSWQNEKISHQSQEQLREPSARLRSLRKEESSNRVIFNDLNQMLTNLKMDVAWLQKRLAEEPDPMLNNTQVMARLINTGIEAVRQITTKLLPDRQERIDLEASIE
jgi:PAS domain S-box-containing protein